MNYFGSVGHPAVAAPAAYPEVLLCHTSLSDAQRSPLAEEYVSIFSPISPFSFPVQELLEMSGAVVA